jgi:hypothetical protein
MKTIYQFDFIGFDELENSNFVNPIQISVMDVKEELALKKAKKMVKKNQYLLRGITESIQNPELFKEILDEYLKKVDKKLNK